jgi:RNA polymerase sigma factor (sigma-70 family)
MMTRPLQGALRQVQTLLDADGVPNAQLLERFLTRHDTAALELLIRRHERRVLGVCRRVLGNTPDADDAFQATFLTLVRKAQSISRHEAVAGWLCRVAYRVAVRAARRKHSRTVREHTGLDLSDIPAPGESEREVQSKEIGAILDEEINRLPEPVRQPVVLCYLQGLSYEAAARQLGCPLGTLSTRLRRARQLLQKALESRGLTLAAALATVLKGEALTAARDRHVETTVRACVAVTTKGRTAGAVSDRAILLSMEISRAMTMTKLKAIFAVLFLLGVASAGAGFLATQSTPA